jgi:hypothetical protein
MDVQMRSVDPKIIIITIAILVRISLSKLNLIIIVM